MSRRAFVRGATGAVVMSMLTACAAEETASEGAVLGTAGKVVADGSDTSRNAAHGLADDADVEPSRDGEEDGDAKEGEEPSEEQVVADDEGAQDIPPEQDRSGFVLLTDAVPDAILEIRYYSTYNFVGDRIDGYEQPIALITREAGDALRQASDSLVAQGYRIKVYDAYRPQTAVDHFARWAGDVSDTRMQPYFYPDLDKSVLFDLGYIAYRSGHSRGSTVDLTLFDMSLGREVDMGGTFDFFGERSHPGFAGVTEEQYANRMVLRDAMLSAGFAPIEQEWWHFTLADEPYPYTYFTFPVRALA